MNSYLTRVTVMFLFFVAVLIIPYSVMASTVGNCQPAAFPTISAAVAAAAPGEIIKVCPGTYPEQVVISTPLTLEGIISGNAGRAVITVPSSGFPTVVTSALNTTWSISPQVLVTVPGVNISHITVDGRGGASVSTSYLVGIFYQSGSSGTIRGVTSRNQNTSNVSGVSYGVGIWAENGNPTTESVNIENSSIHDVGYWGILLGSSQTPPSLTAAIVKNEVETNTIGIYNFSANATITNNVVTQISAPDTRSLGIAMDFNSVGSITSNTVSGAIYGIYDAARSPASIKSNLVWNSTYGIYLTNGTSNATVELNTITQTRVGIEFYCATGPNTVTRNFISDATIGLDQVPLSVVSVNSYDNVDIIQTNTCGF